METSHLEWVSCRDMLPEDGAVVMTKIDDGQGCRNEQELKLHHKPGKRPLWFLPDGSMYVYYTPTHWASRNEIENSIPKKGK